MWNGRSETFLIMTIGSCNNNNWMFTLKFKSSVRILIMSHYTFNLLWNIQYFSFTAYTYLRKPSMLT